MDDGGVPLFGRIDWVGGLASCPLSVAGVGLVRGGSWWELVLAKGWLSEVGLWAGWAGWLIASKGGCSLGLRAARW